MSGSYLLVGSNLQRCEKIGKMGVFLDGYGQIGEIPHGRIWPDWVYRGLNIGDRLMMHVVKL